MSCSFQVQRAVRSLFPPRRRAAEGNVARDSPRGGKSAQPGPTDLGVPPSTQTPKMMRLSYVVVRQQLAASGVAPSWNPVWPYQRWISNANLRGARWRSRYSCSSRWRMPAFPNTQNRSVQLMNRRWPLPGSLKAGSRTGHADCGITNACLRGMHWCSRCGCGRHRPRPALPVIHRTSPL